MWENKNKDWLWTTKFNILKSTPKLLGAKVEIKILYYDEAENETVFYEQAVIEKILQKLKSKPWTLRFLNV